MLAQWGKKMTYPTAQAVYECGADACRSGANGQPRRRILRRPAAAANADERSFRLLCNISARIRASGV